MGKKLVDRKASAEKTVLAYSEVHRCLHTLDNFPHGCAMGIANTTPPHTHIHTQSPLQMSQHHYHAVLISARVIHLNSNQDGCDSSLAAAPMLSWLVSAVNMLSLVFSRSQIATRCWNLPLKHPVIRTRLPGLALFVSRCTIHLQAERCAVASVNQLSLRRFMIFANLYP